MKTVYSFDEYPELEKEKNGPDNVLTILGRKSALLAQLKAQNIKVPESFTITTEFVEKFNKLKLTSLPCKTWQAILDNVHQIEEKTGKKLGSLTKPLFLAIRGDATSDMSGMLSTVLNIGINDLTVRSIESETTNRAFAYDTYARFIKSYGIVVNGIEIEKFDKVTAEYMKSRGLKALNNATPLDWIELTKIYKSIYLKRKGIPFPQDPIEQLKGAVTAVIQSFTSEKLKKYASYFNILNNLGYSVLIQEMIYGNSALDGLSAKISTRNPSTGESKISGNVANISLCCDIEEGLVAQSEYHTISGPAHRDIENNSKQIEQFCKGPQEIDFVLDPQAAYVLNVKPLFFSGAARFAAVRDMANEGMISKEDALMCLTPDDLNALSGAVVEKEPRNSLAEGTPAGAGVVGGKAVFEQADLIKLKDSNSIYIKEHITPLDFNDIVMATAVVTCDDPITSYAARLLRMLRKPGVLGAKFTVDLQNKIAKFGETEVKSGQSVTVSHSGKLFNKIQKSADPKGGSEAAKSILEWADEIRKGKCSVLAPVATSADIDSAKGSGSDGLAFFPMDSLINGKRVDAMKQFVEKGVDKGLAQLKADMAADLKPIIAEKGISIMLLDDPLSKYLSDPVKLTEEISVLRAQKEFKEANDEEFKKEKDLNAKISTLEAVKRLKESNPLMGTRGVRMAIVNQKVFNLEMEAIAEAAKSAGVDSISILLPDVTDGCEIAEIKKLSKDVLSGINVRWGASVESTRACLMMECIAPEADFIALSTTGLQQTVFGMCKGDADKLFVTDYLTRGYLRDSPFKSVDEDAVGELMRTASKDAKSVKSDIEIVVYGEQCGVAKSIKFCTTIGLDAIACPPSMVPVAKLCCAQAVISNRN